jgi:predicted permease
MTHFLIIAICFAAGWLVKRRGILPKGSHQGINTWIVYVALPAVALKYIPAIQWSSSILLPAAMPIIVWFGAVAAIKLYASAYKIDKQTEAALIIVSGLGNTSFIGFPLVSAYYGEQWLSVAAISDQVSFALLSTFAAALAIKASGKGESNIGTVAKRLIGFPPFIAVAVAFILPHFISLGPLNPLFDKLASTLSPLALFSVGLQFELANFSSDVKSLSVAIGYKLLLAPAIILLIGLAFHLHGMNTKIAVFEASVGPMISAGILAEDFGLNPRLSNLVVSIGILIAFVTTAAWYLVMEWCV